MPVIPAIVTAIVSVFLSVITVYFVFLISLSMRNDQHQPAVLQSEAVQSDN